MKTMSFRYAKPDGDVSTRVFIPLVKPSDNYFGIDISELDVEDQIKLEESLMAIQNERDEKISALMKSFDVKHSFRSFKPERMQDVEEV